MKARYSTANYLGNAAVIGDNKRSFLHAMTDWIQNWQEKKILICEKLTLTSQTASAFVRTLKYHASLIKDLLAGGYDLIMTSRFQSDPLERRFGQYRQMSDGRFLVGLREATSSQKIIKLKVLLKEDIDISNITDSNAEHYQNIETLLHHFDLFRCSDEMVTLSEDSREVAIYIAGYVGKKLKERFGNCCNGLLTGDSGADNPDFSYVQILSRGCLTILSTNLVNYVCTAFSILEFVNDLITKYGLLARKATERVLIHCFQSFEAFAYTTHEVIPRKITNSTAVNIYFNKKRKNCTDSVAAGGVKTFKKRQKEKVLIKIYCFYFCFGLMLCL